MESPAAVPFGDLETSDDVRGRRGYALLAFGLTLPTVAYLCLRLFSLLASDVEWDAWIFVLRMSRLFAFAVAVPGALWVIKHITPSVMRGRHQRLLGLAAMSTFAAVFAQILDTTSVVVFIAYLIHVLTALEFLRLSRDLLEARGNLDAITRRIVPLFLLDAVGQGLLLPLSMWMSVSFSEPFFLVSEGFGALVAAAVIYTAVRTYLSLAEPFVDDTAT